MNALNRAARHSIRLATIGALAAAVLAVTPARIVQAQPTVSESSLFDSLVLGARTLVEAAQLPLGSPYPPLIVRHSATLARFASGREGISLAAAAHWKPERHASSERAAKVAALDSLVDLVSECCLAVAAVLESTTADVVAARDLFVRVGADQRSQSQALLLANLKEFEKKFGPTAPKLNIVEVGLNYAAQRLAAFRPNARGGPSPLELVASYVPDYVATVDGNARVVTAAEIGLRYYFVGEGWGPLDGGGMLRPGHTSLGLAVAGANDGALQSVWRGEPRFGAFVAWGNIKFAVVGLGGDAQRILLSRQFQKIPWVF
ncbi:MAG: hypothetical protein O2973_03290 [Gemmatimonadetes bacterium]|nr:hypothetical protein [Gemmatimonadota bacterium]